MALRGYAKLELFRKGQVVKRIEKHNAITPWVDNAINEGNFHGLMAIDKLQPIRQWYDGCLLTDVENNPQLSMIAGNARITAQAGNDSYSGSNSKRGSYNTIESCEITGGFREVFDWNTSQGNGTIASVCLTQGQFGKLDLASSTALPDAVFPNVTLGGAYSSDDAINTNVINSLSIIDYEKERGYRVKYASGIITVGEYAVNTKQFHLLGNSLFARLIETHEISQTVTGSGSDLSVSYTGDHIYLISTYGNSTSLYVYDIDTNTWNCTATTHTYPGVSFVGHSNVGDFQLKKDINPVIDGYVWAWSEGGKKIVKCNLTNDADITVFDNPLYTIYGITSWQYNTPSVVLPNGDWYKTSINNGIPYALYYHNDVFYVVARINCGDYSGGTNEAWSINGNSYGTVVTLGIRGRTQLYTTLQALFPYVSTVNNLEEPVIKSADLTMKLTYELTEA